MNDADFDDEHCRHLVLEQFRWVDGHADVWRLLWDPGTLTAVIAGLAAPWHGAGITKVCAIEARGYLFGPAVAAQLGVGFAAIRKDEGLYPGEKVEVRTEPDYRGRRHLLRMQRRAVTPGERVLVVDDWAESGSQATAAHELVDQCRGKLIGLSLIVDQLTQARAELGRVTAIVRYDELPPCSVI